MGIQEILGGGTYSVLDQFHKIRSNQQQTMGYPKKLMAKFPDSVKLLCLVHVKLIERRVRFRCEHASCWIRQICGMKK